MRKGIVEADRKQEVVDGEEGEGQCNSYDAETERRLRELGYAE